MSPQTRRCVRMVRLKYWRWQGGVALSAITTKFSVLSVSPVSRHMSCAG